VVTFSEGVYQMNSWFNCGDSSEHTSHVGSTGQTSDECHASCGERSVQLNTRIAPAVQEGVLQRRWGSLLFASPPAVVIRPTVQMIHLASVNDNGMLGTVLDNTVYDKPPIRRLPLLD